MLSNIASLDEARRLDTVDPFAESRRRFDLPKGVIYLDGNSLGPLPKATKAVVENVVQQQWGHDLIRSWNDHDWIRSPGRVGDKIAKLVGAKNSEVIVADSVSVNIFKLLTALCKQQPKRTHILSEAGNFPTDVHVAAGAAELFNLDLQLVSRDQILDNLNQETTALLLTHVHYKTAQKYNMAEVNKAAAEFGVPVLWDLSHSVGAMPLDLADSGTQYAVGCGYKYLNGGPGAPAFVYVAAEQQEKCASPLQGWMGHASPFAFEDSYQPADGMDRFLIGTPPMLSLLALESAVDEFLNVDLQKVWEKSCVMFEFFRSAMGQCCPQLQLISPSDSDLRGSHISFCHPDAWPINNALIAKNVIGDFRTPDVLRFGLTPLHARFEDLWTAVQILAGILKTEEWRQPEYSREATVT